MIILGCGDVGRRVVTELLCEPDYTEPIVGYVTSQNSLKMCRELGVLTKQIDLDNIDSLTTNGSSPLKSLLQDCHNATVIYTVAPPKEGVIDLRSKSLLRHFDEYTISPNKVVLISTTGVYGDYQGEWVTEQSSVNPLTERGKRRLDSEQQWFAWGAAHQCAIVVLRVPGIYANSRLPRERIAKRIPVVNAAECGFTNRIHADDLAHVCVVAAKEAKHGEIYNVTDGTPGKITEYLQAAARVLEEPPLPEISMQEAQSQLSIGMLSYLGESRKISNKKLLDELSIVLKYPDFNKGILV